MGRAAVIYFEPDGYTIKGPRLMGRHAAGHAFLRAAVAGRGTEPVICLSPSKAMAAEFVRLVRTFDDSAVARWIPPGNLTMLADAGALYTPGPGLLDAAFLRLRAPSPAAYSLIGVTHTTASRQAMEAIAGLVRAPVMPWDALICTSQAVRQTVDAVLESEATYLAWRMGLTTPPPRPQLPVIPLGVHCDDFARLGARKAAARAGLGIAEDEIAVLFVGRLSFHAKAHPHAMYRALEEAARRSGRKVVLIQCGWFANDAIGTTFKSAARAYAPNIRALFSDGREPDQRETAWAAADIFISLSDNIQETFGLSPIEAMARGLPVVVSDWDGYRETVRDGIDGFRVATAMPEAGSADGIVQAYEADAINYDQYCAAMCRLVSVDHAQLIARLCDLIGNTGLRETMGAAGAERARTVFDWSVIYRRYRELYDELAERRAHSSAQPDAPRSAASMLDPTRSFAHYPSHPITRQTRVTAVSRDGAQHYSALSADLLFSYLPELLPPAAFVDLLFKQLSTGPKSIDALAHAISVPMPQTIQCVAILAKMGLVALETA